MNTQYILVHKFTGCYLSRIYKKKDVPVWNCYRKKAIADTKENLTKIVEECNLLGFDHCKIEEVSV